MNRDNEARALLPLAEFLAEAATEQASKEMSKLAEELVFRLRAPYRIGIITALPHEKTAMLSMVPKDQRERLAPPLSEGASYWCLRIPCVVQNQQDHEVVLCETVKMGNNSAAVAATCLLKDFRKIDSLIMVGIAGGIPNPLQPGQKSDQQSKDHVRLGDIVVSEDGVFQYDMLKAELDQNIERGEKIRPSKRLLQACRELQSKAEAGEYPWETFIKSGTTLDGYSSPPIETDIIYAYDGVTKLEHPPQSARSRHQTLVHYGLIGSANILLKDPSERDRLKSERKIIAVEMEGSGIADAAWCFDKGYLIVRGICDYCDMKKKDDWQRYAAVVAAAYTRALIGESLSS